VLVVRAAHDELVVCALAERFDGEFSMLPENPEQLVGLDFYGSVRAIVHIEEDEQRCKQRRPVAHRIIPSKEPVQMVS